MSPTRRDFLKTSVATATSLSLLDGAESFAAALQAPTLAAPSADPFAIEGFNFSSLSDAV
jgi:hypothetical protein